MRFAIIIGLGAGLGTLVRANQVTSEPREFNVTCPANRLCSELEQHYQGCARSRESNACDYFIVHFRELTAEYDCQRSFDHTPTADHVVPAIWLCAELDKSEPRRQLLAEYIALLHDLKTKGARCLFASAAFRGVLDGHLAEEFLEASLRAEKKSKKWKCPSVGGTDRAR